jgi:hypothetical protein
MKKNNLTYIFALIFMLLLSSCQSSFPAIQPEGTTSDHDISTEEETTFVFPPPVEVVNQNPKGKPSSNPSKISGIEPNDGGFGMSFKYSEGSFTRGEVMLLDITLINNTGKTYAWTGSSSVFHPTNVKLWCVKEDGQKYRIPHRSLPDTEDICYNEVKNGESYTRTYVFDIPEDAPAGDYTLTCEFRADKNNGGRKDTIIFEGYFRLEE